MKKISIRLLFLVAATSIYAEYSISTPVLNINVTNVLILILLFVTVITTLKRGRIRVRFASLAFLCMSIVGFGAISFEVQYASEHFRTVITLSKGLLVVLLMTYWLNRYEEVKTVAIGVFVAGVIAFIGSALQGYFGVGNQFFAGAKSAGSRLPGLGVNVDIVRSPGFVEGLGLFGVYVESAALLAATGFVAEGRRQGVPQTLAWVGVLLAVGGLLLSQSRSGILATLIGYVVFYLLYTWVYRGFKSLDKLLVTALFLGITISGVYIWENIKIINTLSITNRLVGYRLSIIHILENPILGIGFSGVGEEINYYRAIHNSYLKLALSGGLISFVGYIFLNFKAVAGVAPLLHPHDKRAPLAISLLSVLAATVVECALWGGGLFATVVFIIIGLLVSLGNASSYKI